MKIKTLIEELINISEISPEGEVNVLLQEEIVDAVRNSHTNVIFDCIRINVDECGIELVPYIKKRNE
jgi:enterochelin esterase-like enzyme